MNNVVYRKLDYEKIITKDHYYRNNKKLVLLPFNHSWIGKKTEKRQIYEKISLEDFRILKDDEIVNKEHFYVFRDDYGYLVIYRCYSDYHGEKANDVCKQCSHLTEFNLYAKQKTQFNFETLNILKDIQL
jgi:hypothetical protein